MAAQSLRSFHLACLSVCLSALALRSAHADNGWQNGRATWFDVENDDLRTANCHMSWDQSPTGRNVGAMSDTNPLFASSCGLCVEVRCQGASFTDGFGNYIDRSNSCSDPHKSVMVTIADACPCNYQNNQYSNKRWCCGDDASRAHLDITRSAFSQLADLNLGVIGTQWRVVDCAVAKAGTQYYNDVAAPSNAPAPASSGGNGGSGGGSWGFLGKLFGRR